MHCFFIFQYDRDDKLNHKTNRERGREGETERNSYLILTNIKYYFSFRESCSSNYTLW